ncbi:MAG: hypothetical protein A2600_07085 [Candidatus Lambdaproteobacteria bacterium RIFOXYD1_FULL_56_27]|uniref:Uncharacterized protein n=1 Tax=Candidatus Lambdaproteobacteria bacterium RIFOXYD2_FULL_56_26 TaxID=1817773 RepID=A0A1F6GQ47_9PROT|nr:MAG: hypothetical protein A2557_05745 [Candidatus Lambdaproteobacteria bacterium RIFOXYD2_FULL_56_26]OGH03695.1 MAG: hypothetical protein A2426_00535 [Candidatus Lambdaproteobacteria bacterium RIFOXYC1_FULL_56_13]OGH07279.1 MAG: hypothetical protein A2600_07085 [Candidatus Lambdaproteobacteria bacterium RIFOXYD1_FULL_56_27]
MRQPLLALLLFVLLLGLGGCKDTAPTHAAALLETCKLALDRQKWDDAVTACAKITTDEGYHLTAQAYMGRAGVSLLDILSGLSGGSGSVTGLFSSVPATAAATTDSKKALDALFSIAKPGQTVYLEGLLLSSLLIIKELKILASLSVAADGTVTHCASGGSLDGCSFSFSLSKTTYTEADVLAGVIPVSMTYSGLGTDIYAGLCSDSGSQTHNTKVVTATSTVNDPLTGTAYPVQVTEKNTIAHCTIKPGSVLYYNKVASANLTSSISGLAQLNFYAKMDTGNNYSKTFTSSSIASPGITISICNADAIPVTEVTDLLLNDCELLYFLTNFSLK